MTKIFLYDILEIRDKFLTAKIIMRGERQEEKMLKKQTKIIIAFAAFCCVSLGVFCTVWCVSNGCTVSTDERALQKYIADFRDVSADSIDVLSVKKDDGGTLYTLFREHPSDGKNTDGKNIGLLALEKVGIIPNLYKMGCTSRRSEASISTLKFADPENSSVVIFGDNTVFDGPEYRASRYTVSYGTKTFSDIISGDYFIIPFDADDAEGKMLNVQVFDANGKCLAY